LLEKRKGRRTVIQRWRTSGWCSSLALAGVLGALGCTPEQKQVEESVAATQQQALTLATHVVEGYWHNFYNGSVCPMRLTSITAY